LKKFFFPMPIELSFGRCDLLAGDRLARALARAGIGSRALSPNGKVLAVPQAPVTADVHESFYVHAEVRAKVALHRKFAVYYFSYFVKIFLGTVTDLLVQIEIRLLADPDRGRTPYPENVGKGDLYPLVVRYFYSCYACHFRDSFRRFAVPEGVCRDRLPD
jgi:hypothetical protein